MNSLGVIKSTVTEIMKINIKLYDINGKVLINNFYETTNIRFKTEFLSNGIYFIDIEDSRNLVTKKISIKH